ncbi:transmembrane 9 superfamily member 12-like [Zingiber officinale]|uniref:transmembrane 9 superfamily member 12-like n=1 Tax=Zingiber officinale TaxID=94328 RepID=UPI001C4C5353|nr:transmembrane 9 superfamily member 12-like [Zingiber officinale]
MSNDAFYLHGSYIHTYIPVESIYAKVNSLTSLETELPYSYYSLPYCHPQGGIKRSVENLGELLVGDQIDNSPYQFHVNVNELLYLCTTNALNEHEVKLLKQRAHDLYQVNMILDNLQAMLKLNMYDKVESVSCPLELDKSQTIREQEKMQEVCR